MADRDRRLVQKRDQCAKLGLSALRTSVGQCSPLVGGLWTSRLKMDIDEDGVAEHARAACIVMVNATDFVRAKRQWWYFGIDDIGHI